MSLIKQDQHFLILAVLFAIVALSIYGERKRWFGNISGVLVAIILAAIFASVKLIPSGSNQEIVVPVYDFAFTYLIPLSIPLLLFNVRFKKIIQESGRLMTIFLIGAVGVVIGAVIAGWMIDLGENTYKLAAVYTATYTGGSVNFMAVASTFDFLEDPLFAASIVVDNVFTIFYIMLLFLLPKLKFLQKHFPEADRTDDPIAETAELKNEKLFEHIATSLAISGVIVGVSVLIAPIIEGWLHTELSLDVLIITILILIAANIFHNTLEQLEAVAFQIGMYMLYVFLAVIGATCNLPELFTSSPKVLLFAIIVISIHLAISMIAGKFLKFSLEEIAIASGANAGGVSISAPMAATFEMKKAVTPAILIGIMGYVVGTFLGIGVGLFLQ